MGLCHSSTSCPKNAVIEEKEEHYRLPNWVLPNAKVSARQAELIRKSWALIITDKSSSRTTPLQSPSNSIVDPQPCPLTISEKTSTTLSAQRFDPEASMDVNTITPSPRNRTLNSCTLSPPSPTLEATSRSSLTIEPRRSRCVEFFDTFYSYWAGIDASIDLYFNTIQDKSEVLARMISFFVKHAGHFDEPETMRKIKEISLRHQQARVPIELYEGLAKAALLTLKKSLGADYTHEIYEAWLLAFSQFLVISISFHSAQKVYYVQLNGIKKLEKNVDMSSSRSMSQPSSTQKFNQIVPDANNTSSTSLQTPFHISSPTSKKK